MMENLNDKISEYEKKTEITMNMFLDTILNDIKYDPTNRDIIYKTQKKMIQKRTLFHKVVLPLQL